MTYYSGQTERVAERIIRIFRQERNVVLKMLGKPPVESVSEKTRVFAPKVAQALLECDYDIEHYVRAQYLMGSSWSNSKQAKLTHLPWFTQLLSAEALDKYRRFELEHKGMVHNWIRSDEQLLGLELDDAAFFTSMDKKSQIAYALHNARYSITPLSRVLFAVQYGLAGFDEAVLEAAALQYVRFKCDYSMIYSYDKFPKAFWVWVARLEEEVYGSSTEDIAARKNWNTPIGSDVGGGGSQ
jgi:hypothetical protein